MSIPFTTPITIRGEEYTIEKVPVLSSGDGWFRSGQIDLIRKEILYIDGLSPQNTLNTLAHEAMHGIQYEWGIIGVCKNKMKTIIDDVEEICDLHLDGIGDFIQSNPKHPITKWFTAKVQKVIRE